MPGASFANGVCSAEGSCVVSWWERGAVRDGLRGVYESELIRRLTSLAPHLPLQVGQ